MTRSATPMALFRQKFKWRRMYDNVWLHTKWLTLCEWLNRCKNNIQNGSWTVLKENSYELIDPQSVHPITLLDLKQQTVNCYRRKIKLAELKIQPVKSSRLSSHTAQWAESLLSGTQSSVSSSQWGGSRWGSSHGGYGVHDRKESWGEKEWCE